MSRKKAGAYKRVLDAVKVQPLSIANDALGNLVITYANGVVEMVPVLDGKIAVGRFEAVSADVFRRAIERKIRGGKPR